MQYLSLNSGAKESELKVWDAEMIRKFGQNSVSLHFGTPDRISMISMENRYNTEFSMRCAWRKNSRKKANLSGSVFR